MVLTILLMEEILLTSWYGSVSHYLQGFDTSQVVQDFLHQQYAMFLLFFPVSFDFAERPWALIAVRSAWQAKQNSWPQLKHVLGTALTFVGPGPEKQVKDGVINKPYK